MSSDKPIVVFRGDDTDAIGYQTIVGTIKTTLDLTGCSATFRYLDFVQTFQTIPADRKLVIVMSSAQTKLFPPGFGYASIVVKDANQKTRTFDNMIPIYVAVNTPVQEQGEFSIEWNAVPQLLEETQFDMLSDDWTLRQLVVKLAKHFGLSVTNENPFGE